MRTIFRLAKPEEGWFGQPKYSTHIKTFLRCTGFCLYFLNFDEHDSIDFGDDDSDANYDNKCQKCKIDLTCNINHKTSTQCDQFHQDHRIQMSQKFECENQLDQDQKHECDQSKHDLDIEHVQRLQQLEEDENLALDLQRCYDAEDKICSLMRMKIRQSVIHLQW